MSNLKHPLIASEGWPFILGGLFVLLLSYKLNWWWLSLLCGVYLLVAFMLFRDPYRVVPSTPSAIISPVDGTITNIRDVEEGLLLRSAKVISMRVHKSGAYTTRSPTEGKIMNLSDDEAGSRMVETAGLWIRSDEGDDVVMIMKSEGISAIYPAIASVRYGERVGQGEKVGFNRLTQSIDLYLPDNVLVAVRVGDKVYAGSSVLAEYYRESEATA